MACHTPIVPNQHGIVKYICTVIYNLSMKRRDQFVLLGSTLVKRSTLPVFRMAREVSGEGGKYRAEGVKLLRVRTLNIFNV